MRLLHLPIFLSSLQVKRIQDEIDPSNLSDNYKLFTRRLYENTVVMSLNIVTSSFSISWGRMALVAF